MKALLLKEVTASPRGPLQRDSARSIEYLYEKFEQIIRENGDRLAVYDAVAGNYGSDSSNTPLAWHLNNCEMFGMAMAQVLGVSEAAQRELRIILKLHDIAQPYCIGFDRRLRWSKEERRDFREMHQFMGGAMFCFDAHHFELRRAQDRLVVQRIANGIANHQTPWRRPLWSVADDSKTAIEHRLVLLIAHIADRLVATQEKRGYHREPVSIIQVFWKSVVRFRRDMWQDARKLPFLYYGFWNLLRAWFAAYQVAIGFEEQRGRKAKNRGGFCLRFFSSQFRF